MSKDVNNPINNDHFLTEIQLASLIRLHTHKRGRPRLVGVPGWKVCIYMNVPD